MRIKLADILSILCVALLSGGCAHQTEPHLTPDDLAIPVESPVDRTTPPGSLWSPSYKFVNLFSDLKAKNVGDVVLVQITENSKGKKEANTKTERTNDVVNSIGNLVGLPLNHASVNGTNLNPGITAHTDSEFEGKGKTSRTSDIQATVAARVVRILPSGNMFIRGKKQIRLNHETQYIILSGIIRPDDISSNNTIQSTYIADLRLAYYGSGIIGDQEERGWLSRLVDKVWPF